MIRFRTIFIIMVLITVLLVLAPILLGLASGIFTYHGMCYGFTDGSWECTWQEYISDQVFWCALLEFPLSLYLIPMWLAALILWLYKRRSENISGISFSLAILIPIGGCMGGVCLISILPIFIRFFYTL